MKAVDRKSAPPPELQLALFCGEYHLPAAGGMYDQDYHLIRRMMYLGNVYRTMRKMRSLIGDAINTQLSTDERLMLGDLAEQGYLNG